MNNVLHIPFILRGIPNKIEVHYKSNENAYESGFDVLNLPFNPDLCFGYPAMHACIKDMVNTGYRRYCGWIQLVQREYFSSDLLDKPDENSLSIDAEDPSTNIFFAYGYPAEVFDSPCNNLNGNTKGKWTAYTYLVDMPSRMNDYTLSLLAGFRWGYEEKMISGKLTVKMQDIMEIDYAQRKEHISYLKAVCPKYKYIF